MGDIGAGGGGRYVGEILLVTVDSCCTEWSRMGGLGNNCRSFYLSICLWMRVALESTRGITRVNSCAGWSMW